MQTKTRTNTTESFALAVSMSKDGCFCKEKCEFNLMHQLTLKSASALSNILGACNTVLPSNNNEANSEKHIEMDCLSPASLFAS